MADLTQAGNIIAGDADYDAVVVGASLAGSTAATFLARAGARVALVEQRPDPVAFKRICSHFIQSSAVPTLERLGLLERMIQAGALRSRVASGRAGVGSTSPPAIPRRAASTYDANMLDPLAREIAAETPGVELMLGRTVEELLHDGVAVVGVTRATPLARRCGCGRDSWSAPTGATRAWPSSPASSARPCATAASPTAATAKGPPPPAHPTPPCGCSTRRWPPPSPPTTASSSTPCMLTMDRLPEFRADPARALVKFVSGIPEAPPILASRLFEEPSQGPPVQGRIDMTNIAHTPTAPGLALVGDAALAIDPLWGVGCGWAFQSGEWLADSVAPALLGASPLSAACDATGAATPAASTATPR